MKLGLAKLFISTIIIAALASSAGCAYIKTTQEARDPLRGEINKAALSAEMPPIDDARAWEEGTWDAPNYNIHIFAPAITEKLRADLLSSGLFSALPTPNSQEAADLPYRLEVKVTAFALNVIGSNAYRVPQVIANGALLPAFALTNLATQGQVDMAGYVIPSINLGTRLNAKFSLLDKENEVTLLSRSYLSTFELGAVSQRDIFKGSETGEYGVEAGAGRADEAIKDLADLCSRDPAWKYLNQYKALALAQYAISESESSSVVRCESALQLLPLLEKFRYTAKQVKLLYDDLLDADVRAPIYNEMRARSLGYSSPEDMPKDQIITEEQAEELLNDISLLTDLVLVDLDTKILQLALDAVIPNEEAQLNPAEQPEMQDVAQNRPLDQNGPMPAQEAPVRDEALTQAGPDAQKELEAPVEASPEMREAVMKALVQSVKNDLLMQDIIIEMADKKIGEQWPKMKEILEAIDSPVTKRYLESRAGS